MQDEPITFLDPGASYFDILGVGVGVDEAELTARFRQLSRRFHPDRFASSSPERQNEALASTALVNDAYRTLKDPFLRAEYLLRRERGVRLGELREAQPPKELFARVMELQEALFEFNAGDLTQRSMLESAQQEFNESYERLRGQLNAFLATYEAEPSAMALDGMLEVISRRGYLRRVLENLSRTLG